MDEPIISEEKIEDAEVICGQCTGQMKLVQLPRPPHLFTPVYYHRLVLHCGLCGKTGKQFLGRIIKAK